MKKSLAQKYGASCGLACIAYTLGSSEELLLTKHQNLLSIEKLNFVGIYAKEIVEILGLHKKIYISRKFNEKMHAKYLIKNGTIIYIGANVHYPIGHYLVKSECGWMNPWNHRISEKIPTACYERDIDYAIEWIIFQE